MARGDRFGRWPTTLPGGYSMKSPNPLVTELVNELRERIEECCGNLEGTKQELGEDFDPNSYGTGWDEGEIAGLRYALAFLEMRE